MPRLQQVTPFLRVASIGDAVAFFVDTLGFKVGFAGGTYAYVWRDAVAFRLIEDEPRQPLAQGLYAAYVDVKDVDTLWAELEPKLKLLPADQWCGPPFDQDYGQREFWVKGPDGDIIGFGAGIPGQPET